MPIPTRSPLFRAVAPVLLALTIVQSAACFQWESIPHEGAPVPATKSLGDVEVTRLDGSKLRLGDVMLTRDSVTGIGKTGLVGRSRFAIPRDSVQGMRERHVDWLRSSLLAGGALAVLIWSNGQPPCCTGP